MRAPRWRRYAGLGLAACCSLPLALRLLLLVSTSSGDEPVELALGPADDPDSSELLADDSPPTDQLTAAAAAGHVAGAYLAARRPANFSYCRWQYGLPERLIYVDQQLISSPQSPVDSPHRVLPYAMRGSSDPSLPQVTLCTHATADQVYGVVELARRWEGPLGLAVFAPGPDAGLAFEMLELACRCEPNMAKVSVHLIFPRAHPPSLSSPSSSASSPNCTASELQRSGSNSTERRRLGLSYPINVARNVARALAPTTRVLVSDVELLPSERLASRFIAMIKGRSTKRPIAFVLPVFEVEQGVRPPDNKAQLLAALRSGQAVYFHRFSCPHCQRFPGLTRWILRPDPGRVKPLIITRREYPHNRWEPIFIGTKRDPLYTEEMSWEGRQDKMTQMFEMCLMNYRLIILDGAFLVHRPGIKRKPASDEGQRADERQNARVYQTVTRRLLKKYPANRRCKP